MPGGDHRVIAGNVTMPQVMALAPPQFAPSQATGPAQILVAFDGRSSPSCAAQAASVQAGIPSRFPGCAARVLVARAGSSATLVDAALLALETAEAPPPLPDGDAGSASLLSALLVEADRQNSAAAGLFAGGERDESVDWLKLVFEPVMGGGFDFVWPTYRRHKLDGMLNTAIVYPLIRALFGRGVRQPAAGEGVLSLALVRELLADPDWRREPGRAGSDAWLVAKVLAGNRRVCQAWLGGFTRQDEQVAREDASHILARVVGPVFTEMERHAARWQRIEGTQSVPSFGVASAFDGAAGPASVEGPAAAFRLGLRELETLWRLVLPPAALLELKRAAAARDEALQLEDALWARVVYDFALAHATRTVERQLLLRSMTPLYLGFVAGFVNETRELDGAGTERRIEALCAAFEQEKRYAIARWRWPDHF